MFFRFAWLNGLSWSLWPVATKNKSDVGRKVSVCVGGLGSLSENLCD